jgi:hypothetical protein
LEGIPLLRIDGFRAAADSFLMLSNLNLRSSNKALSEAFDGNRPLPRGSQLSHAMLAQRIPSLGNPGMLDENAIQHRENLGAALNARLDLLKMFGPGDDINPEPLLSKLVESSIGAGTEQIILTFLNCRPSTLQDLVALDKKLNEFEGSLGQPPSDARLLGSRFATEVVPSKLANRPAVLGYVERLVTYSISQFPPKELRAAIEKLASKGVLARSTLNGLANNALLV